jgi:hypothetical protein
MNSTPRTSSTIRTTLSVDCFSCSPDSSRAMVFVDIFAALASWSTPIRSAARAILHCAAVNKIRYSIANRLDVAKLGNYFRYSVAIHAAEHKDYRHATFREILATEFALTLKLEAQAQAQAGLDRDADKDVEAG